MSETEQDVLSALTEDDKEDRGEQTVTIEEVGPGRKALTIEIPETRISKTLEKNFSKLRSDAQVPGFRKGRVPMRLLQRRFGSDVKQDVRGQLISAAYSQALEDEKLEVIGEPDIKDFDEIKLPETGPMSFKVEVEIAPKVELPALEGIAVTKKKLEVTDANVEEEIVRLQERFGNPVDADGPVKEEDFIQAHVHVHSASGEEISHLHETFIRVNGEKLEYKGHVGGILIEDLGKKLIGKNKGEELNIEMTGPTSHEDERIRNQPIKIEIRIDAIKRVEPAPLDSLPQLLNVESVDVLREQVRKQLERRHEAQERDAMRKQASDYLLEKIDLTLPEGITKRQTERLLSQRRLNLLYQGVPMPEIEQRVAEMRTSSEEDARRQLKLFFILTQAAKQLEVEVTQPEINGYITVMAQQQNRRPETLRQEMQQSGEIQYLYLQVREQKTLDAIVAKAQVTEAS